MRFRDVMCLVARHISDELDHWQAHELAITGLALIGAGITIWILFGG